MLGTIEKTETAHAATTLANVAVEASTTRAPTASGARSGRPNFIEMQIELTRQPGGREAETKWVELTCRCVGSVDGTKGAAAPRSVHALLMKTDMTGGACSTEGLTAGVATLSSARAQKAVLLDLLDHPESKHVAEGT